MSQAQLKQNGDGHVDRKCVDAAVVGDGKRLVADWTGGLVVGLRPAGAVRRDTVAATGVLLLAWQQTRIGENFAALSTGQQCPLYLA